MGIGNLELIFVFFREHGYERMVASCPFCGQKTVVPKIGQHGYTCEHLIQIKPTGVWFRGIKHDQD